MKEYLSMAKNHYEAFMMLKITTQTWYIPHIWATEDKHTHTFDLCQTQSYGISAYTVEIKAIWKTVHILFEGIEFLQMMCIWPMSYTHTHTARTNM